MKRKEEQKGPISYRFSYHGWRSSSKVDEFKWYRAYFTITWSIIGIKEIGGPQNSQ
jgi:hypothetical protein